MKEQWMCIVIELILSTMLVRSAGWTQGKPGDSKILYTVDNQGTGRVDLYLSNTSGSNQRKLCDSVCSSARAIFSSDGRYIAFQNSSNQQLIMDTAGNQLFRFAGGNRSDQDFTWGPDYTIYFGTYSWGGSYALPGIWRFRLGDSSLTRIMVSYEGVYDHNPSVSPDNTRIAWVHHEYGYYSCIYVMNIDGANQRQLTDWAGYAYVNYDQQLDLSWVDDNHIVFHTVNFFENYQNSIVEAMFYFQVVDSVATMMVYCPPEAVAHRANDFGRIALSPDRRYIALYSGYYSYSGDSFLDAAQLGQDSLIYKTIGGVTPAFAWSKNAEYFIEYRDGKLEVFDRDLKQYKFSNLSDVGAVRFIEWSRIDPGKLEPVTDVKKEQLLPQAYKLCNNYPNPFNPSTTIAYELPQASDVTLKVFNALGQEVATLVHEAQDSGYKSVQFDGSHLSSGVYFYRLQIGGFVATKRLLLLR